MRKYIIRKATLNDLSFLADIVIAAEKSNSEKLSYSTLFSLSEGKVKDLIISMFAEEVDGCEFSVSSYLIAEFEGKPVAGFGSWIEEDGENMPSKILKANLIYFVLGRKIMQGINLKSDVLSDIYIEREKETLQFEYLYVADNHRGKGLGDELIKQHISNALSVLPSLKKAQVQVFANNSHAINLYERNGFHLQKKIKSSHKDILNYLPFNEKVMMEKILN